MVNRCREANKVEAKHSVKRASTRVVKQMVAPAKERSTSKRKRSVSKSGTKKNNSTGASGKKQQRGVHTEPPSHTLIVDNGGDTVKFGWSNAQVCQRISNVTARLPQQLVVLAGDQLATLQNPNIPISRSTERGVVTNTSNQIQVWKRCLDILGVVVPASETSSQFGWKKSNGNTRGNPVSPHTIAVLISVPPYCPRSVLDQIMTIWYQDFEVRQVGFFATPVTAAIYRSVQTRVLPIACVVDLGWSAIQIACVYNNNVLGLKRIPIGSRHLINIWKHHCSYRQWNLLDQELVMADVFEKTAFVSLDWREDMKTAARLPAGRRPFDREYILPDYTTTRKGTVQTPASVLRMMKTGNDQGERDEDGYDEEMDEDFDEKDIEDESDDDLEENNAIQEELVASEDEESPEEIKKRILLQRAEEERRQRELKASQQVLNLSVERFAIPEVLFRPSDAGLPSEWANLPVAIVQAIEDCPSVFRASLFRSVQLTGGLSQLTNLSERLMKELRPLVPYKYTLNISTSDDPVHQAWNGAAEYAQKEPFSKWSVSREEWETCGKRGAWKKLLLKNGGCLV